MKQALVLAIASFGWAATAFAQAPNSGVTPGPHDPNPPMNAPDLRLPPPCAPAANLAAAGAVVSPVDARAPGPQVRPVDSTDTQCSANTMTQSAELPGLAPGVQ
jgi:hypothetical protein